MKIATVVGNVISTIKDESYYGYKLMIVRYLNEEGEPSGNELIAFDAANAGVGDVVVVCTDGGAANITLDDKKIVADLTICGVIDHFTYDGNTRYYT
jgi:microcompartment protein CcmK/EutM